MSSASTDAYCTLCEKNHMCRGCTAGGRQPHGYTEADERAAAPVTMISDQTSVFMTKSHLFLLLRRERACLHAA